MRFNKSLVYGTGILLAALASLVSPTSARANDLAVFGLGSMQPASVQEATQVRGAGSSAGASGMGFVSAGLFDPNSNSFAMSTTYVKQNASDDNVQNTSRAAQEHFAGIQMINNGGLTQSLQGFVGGFSFGRVPSGL